MSIQLTSPSISPSVIKAIILLFRFLIMLSITKKLPPNIPIRFMPNSNPYNYLLSLLMAGIVFAHALPRRRNMFSLISWVVFAALFNVVGLLVYLSLNFTPSIKCPQCNKKRGLNTPDCPRCGSGLSMIESGKLSIIEQV